jgi:adenosylcobinamide kinase/adenosylcobinamide-phosphate guanylyltransferase
LKSILIIGGARSGKSRLAQELALESGGDILFVATAEAGDEEMKQRIEKHRKARPSAWVTLEATTHIGSQITKNIGSAKTVVIDCITLLLNNIFQQFDEAADENLIEEAVLTEIKELIDCQEHVAASFIIVSNEIGLGIVPADRISRLYRDFLGRANQMLAEHADEVYMLLAGIPVPIKKA